LTVFPGLGRAPQVQKRIDVLAERANEGLLTDNERAEYEALINATDFISTLKIKAQRNLKSNGS
jgi:ribonuclease HI